MSTGARAESRFARWDQKGGLGAGPALQKRGNVILYVRRTGARTRSSIRSPHYERWCLLAKRATLIDIQASTEYIQFFFCRFEAVCMEYAILLFNKLYSGISRNSKAVLLMINSTFG